jgi:hypothetical protein
MSSPQHEMQPFRVHKNYICHSSLYFKATLERGFAEGETSLGAGRYRPCSFWHILQLVIHADNHQCRVQFAVVCELHQSVDSGRQIACAQLPNSRLSSLGPRPRSSARDKLFSSGWLSSRLGQHDRSKSVEEIICKYGGGR